MRRLILGTLGALLLAGAASAATFAVTTIADGVDAAPGNGICATAGGACTLRAAVQEANALAGPDAVTLPAGTFFLTLVGAAEDLGATGDLDVTQPLEVTGAGADLTIVDGLGSDRVFDVAVGQAFTLRQLTVRNGAPGAAPGGGLAHDGGAPLVIEDAAFVANRAAAGGALLALDGALTIHRARFADNRTLSGVGIVVHAAMAAPLEIRDSVFEGNVVTGGAGGGVYYQGSGAVAVTGTRLSRNAAADIGAMQLATTAAVTLEDIVVEDNRALSQIGGVYVTGPSTLDVRRATFRGNRAEAIGGVYAVATGAVTVSDSTIDGNEAESLAGGVLQSATATVTLQSTSVSGNQATVDGIGGMQVAAAGAVTVTGVTVRDNAAGTDVGGVYVQGGGAVTISDSVVEDNAALDGDVGGIYASSATTVTTQRNLVRGNVAFAGAVGGLYVSSPAASIEASTFAGNEAIGGPGAGGGVYATGTTTVVNSTFSGNFASTAGGGLYLVAPGTVDSCTFAGNASPMPGAALLAAPGTVVRGSVIGAGSGDSCAAAATSGGDNVDADGTCALAGPRDRSGLDPQLGPLQDNGGPTPTHEPLEGSPLVDADGGTCPATDQRGVARPFDADGDGTAACDVGAVEFLDECPQDPAKRVAGVCGCGVADVDGNANGAVDCLVNAELKARIATEKTNMQAITGAKDDAQKALKTTVKAGADDLVAYVDANGPGIVPADPAADLGKLATKARKLVRRTLKGKGKALQKKQAKAATALDTLDAAVAPQ